MMLNSRPSNTSIQGDQSAPERLRSHTLDKHGPNHSQKVFKRDRKVYNQTPSMAPLSSGEQ